MDPELHIEEKSSFSASHTDAATKKKIVAQDELYRMQPEEARIQTRLQEDYRFTHKPVPIDPETGNPVDLRTSHMKSFNIRSIRGALTGYLPYNAYRNYDEYVRKPMDSDDRLLPLHHALGTKYAASGAKVIEIDCGGSSFKQFRKDHVGYHGKESESGYTEHFQQVYGTPVELEAEGKTYHAFRKDKEVDGNPYQRYTISGPKATNTGEFQINNVRDYVFTLGKEYIEKEFKAQGDTLYKPIILNIQGHSRGGVAASNGVARLADWILEHPQLCKLQDMIQINLIQHDPVPGIGSTDGIHGKLDLRPSDYRQYSNPDDPEGSVMVSGAKFINATSIVSLHSEHSAHGYPPQNVRGQKRIILTAGKHGVGLDQADASQVDALGHQKLHRSAGIDAETMEVYRGSGYSELPPGVYFQDENGVLIRMRCYQHAKSAMESILQDTHFRSIRHETIDDMVRHWFEDNPAPELRSLAQPLPHVKLRHVEQKPKQATKVSNARAFVQEQAVTEDRYLINTRYRDLPAYEKRDRESIESREEFFRRFAERYKKTDPAVAARVQTAEQLPLASLPAEPELSYKERKEKKNRIAQKGESTKKAFRYATHYTGYISELLAAKQEKQRNRVKDGAPAQPQFTVRDLYKKDINPAMFEYEYFGEHFDLVDKEIDDLSALVAAFKDPATRVNFSTYDSERYETLKKSLEFARACYIRALRANNIEYSDIFKATDVSFSYQIREFGDTDTGMTPTEDLNDTIDKYKQYQLSNKTAAEAEEEKNVDADITEQLRFDRPEMWNRTRSAREQHRAIKGVFYSETAYLELSKYMHDLDDPKYEKRVTANREAVLRGLDDYVKSSESLAAYLLNYNACVKLEKRFLDAHKDPKKYTTAEVAHLNMIRRKKDANQNNATVCEHYVLQVKRALDYMIYDKRDFMDETQLMRAKYGDREAQKNITATTAYAKEIEKKNATLHSWIEKKFYHAHHDFVYDELKNDPLRYLFSDTNEERNEEVFNAMTFLHRGTLLPRLHDLQFQAGDTYIMHDQFKHLPQAAEDNGNRYVTTVLSKYVRPMLVQFEKEPLPDITNYTAEQTINMQPAMIDRVFVGEIIRKLDMTRTDVPKTSQLDLVMQKPGLQAGESVTREETEAYKKRKALLYFKARKAKGIMQASRAAALLHKDLRYLEHYSDVLTDEEKQSFQGDPEDYKLLVDYSDRLFMSSQILLQ